MKKEIFLLTFAVITMIAVSCSGSSSHKQSDSTTKEVLYTCTMHPEVISDKPGSCPKCGMTLVVKE